MRTLTAFVAKSFRREDRQKTEIIEQFLDRFKKLGFVRTTAEQAEVESVSQKVRSLIDTSDAFVGILTRRHPLYETVRGMRNGIQVCLGRIQPCGWSAPPWVLQESGYALRAGKPLILFREADVDIGGLQGDLEYIPYDPERPDAALARAHEMVNGLIAKESSIRVEVITQTAISAAEPHEAPAPVVPAEPSPEEGSSLTKAVVQLAEAIDARDFRAAEAAFTSGLAKIDPTDASNVTKWKSLYYSWTYKIGCENSLAALADLQSHNPTDPTPTLMIAAVYREFQQHDNAAQAYERASEIAAGENSVLHLVTRAECLRNAKRLEEARSQLEQVLARQDLSPTLRVNALKELYSVLKELSEEEPAFAVGELILVTNPGDADFRFTLAYDCQGRHPSLALYHYELICGQRADALTLNNLGYAYQENKLPIHGARKYKQAADLKLPRAFRNLGLSYADAGLADDALALLEGAKDTSDPEGLIPQAMASIHEQITSEETRRTEIIESTRQHREFLSVAGEALVSSPEVPVSGEWAFPFGDLTLLQGGKEVNGEGVKLSSGGNTSLAGLISGQMLAGSSLTSNPIKQKTTFRFEGDLAGRLCRFTVKAKISYDNPYMSNEAGETRRGYIAFEPDGTSARVAEYKSERPTIFYRITKGPV